MNGLLRLLPFLAAAPLCTSFAPCNPTLSRASNPLHATSNNELENTMERVGKSAGAAFLALTFSFSTINGSPDAATISTVPPANAMPATSSITIASRKQLSEDDIAIQQLEKETREVERLAKIDAQKARVEKSREAFFEYEAKMAEQTEERIEAMEKKAELEFEKDKEEAEKFKAMEEKAEKEALLAKDKKEKAAKQKEAKALLAKEREAERKEKRALKAEKVFLAEEQQEQKILKQKVAAERAEEAKFEAVEKEYETVAELAKEDEEELALVKSMFRKK